MFTSCKSEGGRCTNSTSCAVCLQLVAHLEAVIDFGEEENIEEGLMEEGKSQGADVSQYKSPGTSS